MIGAGAAARATAARRLLAGLAAALAFVLVATPALAATDDSQTRQDQIGAQVGKLQDQVDEASAQEAALLGLIDASRAHSASLAAAVHDLDAKITAGQQTLTAAEAALTAADQAREAASEQLDSVTARLAAARTELKRRAIDSYVGVDATSASAAVMDTRSERDMIVADGYGSIVVDAQQAAVDRSDRLRQEATSLARQMASASVDAHRRRDMVAAEQASLQAQRNEQAGLQRQAADEAGREQDLLAQVQAGKALFESQIELLESESADVTALLQSLQESAGAPGGHGIMTAPIAGAPITSPFGPRVHPIFETVRMHTGVDFGAAEGTPIHAAADGRVLQSTVMEGYGNVTIIDHGHGLATLYGHQSKMLVTAGQDVKRGQVIGLVGHTGDATGPHLHLEVRINGTPVDPLPYL
jgi:murein DD-endopeptidase MepM/ murein hydrolase activator NlpD